MTSTNTPTLATYTALQDAFDHFNTALFAGKLPQCLITLRSSVSAYGYMHSERFVSVAGERIDELGINPGYFAVQSMEEVMATVVHEMAHHWQNHVGTASKSSPHNREWAAKMEEIGLMPSHTGLPGGKQTGRTMSDYILPDGAFMRACASLTARGFNLPWLDSHLPVASEQMSERREALAASGVAAVGGEPPVTQAKGNGVELKVRPPTVRAAPTRVRLECPKCAVRAWAAPGTALSCGTCGVALEESESVA